MGKEEVSGVIDSKNLPLNGESEVENNEEYFRGKFEGNVLASLETLREQHEQDREEREKFRKEILIKFNAQEVRLRKIEESSIARFGKIEQEQSRVKVYTVIAGTVGGAIMALVVLLIAKLILK